MTPGDEAAIGESVAAFYATFDNRGGRVPDEARLRAAVSPTARITRVTPAGADSWDLGAFLEPRLELLTGGRLQEFHEWEVTARTVGGERIASRWSEYAKAGVMDGVRFQGGGRKVIQLLRQGDGWLISSVLWEDVETPAETFQEGAPDR